VFVVNNKAHVFGDESVWPNVFNMPRCQIFSLPIGFNWEKSLLQAAAYGKNSPKSRHFNLSNWATKTAALHGGKNM
jgi:hypothetical protein